MSDTELKVVIVGAGYGGLMCAARLARHRNVRITVVNPRPTMWHRIRAHELLAGRSLPSSPLVHWLPRRAELCLGMVERVDTSRRQVVVTRDGEAELLPYDAVVIATGSRCVSRIDGVGARFMPDRAVAARAALERLSSTAPLAVVGGGLTGLEVVSELAETFGGARPIHWVGAELGAGLGVAARRYVVRFLEQRGVTCHRARALASHEDGIETTNGRLQVAWLMEAIGFEPNPVPLDGVHGRVPVDPWMRWTGDDRVFVVGDACGAVGDQSAYRESCAAAMPQGAFVGESLPALLAGREIRPFSLRLPVMFVSLGRTHGLIQRCDGSGAPVGRPWTGRSASWAKRCIVTMASRVPRWEARTGWRWYRYPAGTNDPTALPSAEGPAKRAYLARD